MVELVPQIVDGVVVLNVRNVCRQDCRSCTDVGVAVHNWLLLSELNYVLIDLQDEKEICGAFLVELIQLHKRLRVPFLFIGVVDRPRAVLNEYMFASFGYPTFVTPEEAVEYLKTNHKNLAAADLDKVVVDEPLQVSRSRLSLRGLEGDGDIDLAAEE